MWNRYTIGSLSVIASVDLTGERWTTLCTTFNPLVLGSSPSGVTPIATLPRPAFHIGVAGRIAATSFPWSSSIRRGFAVSSNAKREYG